jgi:serine/threonine protein kinase
MLGYDTDGPVFSAFDSEKIGDVWLPLSVQYLSYFEPYGLSTEEFNRMQMHVLSKTERITQALDSSDDHAHRYLRLGRPHFDELELLGSGGSAEVSRVKHKITGKEFARKRIVRGRTIKDQRGQLIEFEQEVAILKRVRHRHLVTFIASYSDLESFSLILGPVANDVLKSMLSRQSRERPLSSEDIGALRRSFGCLATALAYLHEQKVRHKDIKPGNILISNGTVYLCDFGISRDWSASEHSTTTGDVIKYTRRYCAPEVSDRDPRNSTSDIWSLGCVFLEIISVIKGYPLEEMNHFLLHRSMEGLWNSPDAVNFWLEKMKNDNSNPNDDVAFDWITTMMRIEPNDRPRASKVVKMIQEHSADLRHTSPFIGSCCSRADSVVRPELPRIHSIEIPYVDSPTLFFPPVASGLGIRNVRDPHSPRDGSVSPKTQSIPVPRDSSDSSVHQPPAFQRALPGPGSINTESSRTSESIPELVPLLSATSPYSPVPPPANFDLKCSCSARLDEVHIFNSPFSSFSCDMTAQTIETFPHCEVGENKIQIYQTRPARPGSSEATALMAESPRPEIEWVTRRLVVSHISENPQSRVCGSFWLPLADVFFAVAGPEVTLQWSDCNQVTSKSSGNYGRHYNWVYNPNHRNNSLTLRFNDPIDARRFLDCVRFPTQNDITVRNGRKVEVSEAQEAHIYDICRQEKNFKKTDYRTVVITNRDNPFSSSKLHILWPHLDIELQVVDHSNHWNNPPDYHMVLKIDNLTTPTYYSDLREQPAEDPGKIGKFKTAHQIPSSFTLSFPLGATHSLPDPQPGVVALLLGITGWTLCYFAIIDKFKFKNRRFGSKRYGRADIMLWEKDIRDHTGRRHATQVTLRTHEEGVDGSWFSGTISDLTSITYSNSADAAITVSNKIRGKLLDVTKMAAISSDSRPSGAEHVRSPSDVTKEKELSELVLTFEESPYRLAFVNLVERFKSSTIRKPITNSYESRRLSSLRHG